MIKMIRWLKGYVKIKLWGYAPERFMNLCTNRGIVLWGLTGYGGFYTMYMSLSDFFSIKDIAGKTKTRAAVLERYGLPFFWRDMKKRKMFLAGLLFCPCFLFCMSRFLWAIEFQGNYQITDEMLHNFLASRQIDYGVRTDSILLEELEAALRESFPQITWTSAALSGTKLTVKIKENDLPTKEERQEKEYADGADLVAAQDGVVAKILTRAGVPRVREGDTVKKGDVIISGLLPVTNDDGTVREWQRCRSDGDVWIACQEPVYISCPFAYQYKNYTGREKTYYMLTIGEKGIRLPWGRPDFVKWDEVAQKEQLRLFGQVDLPFSAAKILCREYLPVEARYDQDSAQKKLSLHFAKILKGLEEKGVQILQKDVKIVRSKERLSLTGTLTVLKQAAVPAAITEPDLPGEAGQDGVD